ncbi:hypothetical protein SeKA_D0138 (plasmid) [Salmonella enterica subsp. enterica serovar Kentucky str. CVM29188]|uniref:Uncharacterized protein n=1 Tax=Escherichia coli TaxID=562 RepID=A0A075M9W9_ECOLX|nr:hypothetical protein SeKA_D0138 [Salmonella enterica subsp. enterica serovar Kentucky str. CVM29188]AIF77354.1 hypothetical protein [Escherichia coli]ANH56042.1 hypothetical protein [Escherichia coli]AVR60776.1 hypothetical protein [Escherichia coli]AWF76044.1 hypothetical protein [Escherichia coli]
MCDKTLPFDENKLRWLISEINRGSTYKKSCWFINPSFLINKKTNNI